MRSTSCTILAYNEEKTLEEATRQVHEALAARGGYFEIIIADDGSTDATAEIGLELEEKLRGVRLLRHGRNLGPGSGILTGIRNARCDNICFHPADQQVDFAEVAAALPLLEDNDVVVFSRSGRPGYTPLRRLASGVYIGLAHALFGLREFDDFNFVHMCRRELVQDMPLLSDGVFMCTEILVRAVDRGARVARAEAECKPRKVGATAVFKSRVIRKTFEEMFGFWRARRNGR